MQGRALHSDCDVIVRNNSADDTHADWISLSDLENNLILCSSTKIYQILEKMTMLMSILGQCMSKPKIEIRDRDYRETPGMHNEQQDAG